MKLFHSSFAAHECPKCKLRCLDTSRLAKHICIGKVPNVKRNHFDLVPADDYRHANNSILDQAKRLISFIAKIRLRSDFSILISLHNRISTIMMSTRTALLLKKFKVYAAISKARIVIALKQKRSWIGI